jgi:hypothetical protein
MKACAIGSPGRLNTGKWVTAASIDDTTPIIRHRSAIQSTNAPANHQSRIHNARRAWIHGSKITPKIHTSTK